MVKLVVPVELARLTPRQRLLILIAGVMALLFILVGVLTPSTDNPALERALPVPNPGSSRLGEAPRSERFDRGYQVQLEQRVQEQMQAFRSELDAREQAREARDIAQMDRVARMVNDARAPGAGTLPAPRSPEVESPRPPPDAKFVPIRDGQTRFTESAPMVPGLSNLTQPVSQESDAYVIPPDGWAQGRLINGLVASQGGDYRYTHIRLTGGYHSANDFEQNVDGCVVLGEGSADIAAGRINIKPIKVTCTFPDARTRSWPTAGYVVDSRDGIHGIAATLINSGEGKLAAAGAAGLVQGAGALLAQGALTSTVSPVSGATTSVVTGNPATAMAGGAAVGAGRGLSQQIQEYYDAFRPTVQTGGGVEVTVFLTSALTLPTGVRSVSTVRVAR